MKPIRLRLIIIILILFLIIGYLYGSESFAPEEEKERYPNSVYETSSGVFVLKYPNYVNETTAGVFFLNPPKDVDPKTGIKKGKQIKYDCDQSGKDCKYDLKF
jgi:hypothetical protein